jgi:hypothetical protein
MDKIRIHLILLGIAFHQVLMLHGEDPGVEKIGAEHEEQQHQ